jgi:TM2 domain-containing membrane protein YozV
MQERLKGPDEKFCLECAATIKAKAAICPKCGCPQGAGAAQPDANKKNKNTAGLLAMLLGGLGVHKFYLSEVKQGAFYLVFCFTFIPAIIALFDAVKLFGMPSAEFDRRYNSDM